VALDDELCALDQAARRGREQPVHPSVDQQVCLVRVRARARARDRDRDRARVRARVRVRVRARVKVRPAGVPCESRAKAVRTAPGAEAS